MDRETDGTQNHQKISGIQSKCFIHAQKIESCHCQCHAQPDERADFLSQKNTENRHQHNVHGRNKSGLSYRCKQDAPLLQAACNTKRQSAASTSGDQRFCISTADFHFFFRKSAFSGAFIHKQNHRNQHCCSNQTPNCIKSKGAYVIHSHTLCHKCAAPDQSGQYQQHIIFHLFHSHLSSRSFYPQISIRRAFSSATVSSSIFAPRLSRSSLSRNPQETEMHGIPAFSAVARSTSESPT